MTASASASASAILNILDAAAPLELRQWLRTGSFAQAALAAIARAFGSPSAAPSIAEFPIPDEALTRALDTYSKTRNRMLPVDWFPVTVGTPDGPVTVEFAPPLHPRRGLPRTGFRVRFAGLQAQHKAPDEPGRAWVLQP